MDVTFDNLSLFFNTVIAFIVPSTLNEAALNIIVELITVSRYILMVFDQIFQVELRQSNGQIYPANLNVFWPALFMKASERQHPSSAALDQWALVFYCSSVSFQSCRSSIFKHIFLSTGKYLIRKPLLTAARRDLN